MLVRSSIEDNTILLKYLNWELIIAEKVKEKGGLKTKTKLFALALITMLSLGMLLAPAMSYEPEDPEIPDIIKAWYPQGPLKFTGPCLESTTFEATLVLYNVEMNECNLYAWELTVQWENEYLELVDHAIIPPPGWVDGVDYIILFDKETNVASPGLDTLHVGLTKLGNATGYTDDRIELLWVEFHIIYEPVWHIGCITTDITVIDEEMVKWTDDCGAPMEEVYEGDLSVSLNPARPNMEITFSPDSPVEMKMAQGWINQSHLMAYLWVSNVTKLYDIWAHITWDPDLLHLDIQQVTINEEAFAPPWSGLELDIITESGDIYFWLERPCEKDPIKGTFWILEMEFKVKCVEDGDGVPIDADTLIEICTCSGLSFKDGETEWYYEPGDEVDGYYCILVSDAHYYWTPIPGDFDQNGHVGIEDIAEMADHYGDEFTSWDVIGEGDIVDIYDIIWVAKRYCSSTPPEFGP